MNICLYTPKFKNNRYELNDNLGDSIIHDAVVRELNSIFNIPLNINCFSTHKFPDRSELQVIKTAKHSFVGGSNLLSSKMNVHRQWQVSLRQQLFLEKPILLGVGWDKYDDNANLYTRLLLKMVLNKKYMHSVRDSYTENKLKIIGIKNVLNTGCPTMWPLIKNDFVRFNSKKSDNVLFMLTDYAQDSENDRKLIEVLNQNYNNLYFFPQGSNDLDYLKSLGFELEEFQILKRSISSLDDFLNSDIDFDYIGTRLHGGIKCLTANRKALVVIVDNRAAEIAKDTNISSAERDDFEKITKWINSPEYPELNLQIENILKWKEQFAN